MQFIDLPVTGHSEISSHEESLFLLLRSQVNAKISLSFKRDFENDHSKLRKLVDSRLENQRIWRFDLTSTIPLIGLILAHVREANRVARKTEKQKTEKSNFCVDHS